MSLQLAAASYIYIHYAEKKRKKKQRQWWQTQLYSGREVYSACSATDALDPILFASSDRRL
jgi:hypothetical protein